MTILERVTDDITVLELSGNFTREGNAAFKKHVTSTIDAGARKLLLDLQRVPYMNSSGLGELISCDTALQSVQGQFKLLHLRPRLQALLTITKLSTVFDTFDSDATAMASFSAEEL